MKYISAMLHRAPPGLALLFLVGACSGDPAQLSGTDDATPERGSIGKADATGSCKGQSGAQCGAQSASGRCWCDASCAKYGDCCADAPAVCGVGAAGPNLDYDLLTTRLEVDLSNKTARARITLDASDTKVSFDTKGLNVKAVDGPDGPLPYRVVDGRVDVELPAAGPSGEIVIGYGFKKQSGFEGLLSGGSTFIWPYFCGNLFPCKSDPADGVRLSLDVHGGPQGQTLVYAKDIAADAPSYMVAWAAGAYTYKPLGTTAAGTKVGVYYLSGDEPSLDEATAPLEPGFDWLEKTLGPYSFGQEVASVSVNWGPGAFGGMEHHPFWHVGRDSMGDKTTHLHEAAHGWFGDGIRLACWEDFVLSEGTVTYLTARAVGAVQGAAAEKKVWSEYDGELTAAVQEKDHVAWPSTCNQVDILKDLFTNIPYMKGAFFYRAVEKQVGRAKLDLALHVFYSAHVGKAARMQDMLDTIKAETGFDAAPLAHEWLQKLGVPAH